VVVLVSSHLASGAHDAQYLEQARGFEGWDEGGDCTKEACQGLHTPAAVSTVGGSSKQGKKEQTW